ncbi:MAG: hypothetical protein NNA20_00695 [Nitrospira sp.]|nr:hypothetical protein [Nitrospira sp.]MCP9441086.1 hypothetical protein [Nitrospira sp.]
MCQVAVFVVTGAVLMTGCAIPHVPSRIVYEDPVNFVRLEIDKTVLPEWPQGHFSHPAMLGKEVLRAVLLGLKVQEHRIAPQQWIQGTAPIVPAFDEEEVALLSEQLAEGLEQAQYNERVTFYLSEPLAFFRRMVTSGGIYVRGKELHVILGNWKIIYGIPAYGMIYDRRYPMRPTAAKGFDLLFEPADAVIQQQSSLLDTLFANTKDELVIDLSKLAVSPPKTESVGPTSFYLLDSETDENDHFDAKRRQDICGTSLTAS